MFDGITYNPDNDYNRLSGQLHRVATVIQDCDWHTLKELSKKCNGTEAAVSARLRDLRKEKFGSNIIEREYVSKGLWRYRLVIPSEE